MPAIPERKSQSPSTPHGDALFNEDDEISLFELASTIWSNKSYLFIAVVLAMAASLIYLASTRDVYRAEASIMPLQGRSTIALPSNLMGIQGLKEMIGENMPGLIEAPNSSRIRSVITGRAMNLMLVERHDLLPILYKDDWDMSQQRWKGESDRFSDVLLRSSRTLLGADRRESFFPTPLDGAELLQKKVSVKIEKGNNVLRIEFEDEDPNFAHSMIARYIEALDAHLRSEAIARANESRSYIATLLQASGGDIAKKRLEELSAAFAEQELYAKMKSTFLFEVIDHSILPERPIRPQRLLVMVIAMLAGLMFGLFGIFLAKAFDKHRMARVQEVK